MLRNLKYFIAVAEELNFTRAAKRLHMSQPPLSRQIKNFEKEIGAILFTRSNTGVNLTEAGYFLLNKAYKIVHLYDKYIEETASVHKGEQGNLNIGFTTSSTFFLIPLIKQYKKRYPAVNIVIKELNTTKQLSALESGEINIGFVTTPVPNEKLSVSIINQQKYIIAMPSNHPLAQSPEPVNLRDFKKDAFIIVPREASEIAYNLVMNIFQDNDFFPENYLHAGVSTSLIYLVAEGMGVSILPNSLIKMNINGVIYKDIANSNANFETALVYNKNESSAIIHNFKSFIEYITDLKLNQ